MDEVVAEFEGEVDVLSALGGLLGEGDDAGPAFHGVRGGVPAPQEVDYLVCVFLQEGLEHLAADEVDAPPAQEVLEELVEEGEVGWCQLVGSGAEPEEVDAEVGEGGVAGLGPSVSARADLLK